MNWTYISDLHNKETSQFRLSVPHSCGIAIATSIFTVICPVGSVACVQVRETSVVSFDYGRTVPTRFLFSARIGLHVLLNSATS